MRLVTKGNWADRHQLDQAPNKGKATIWLRLKEAMTQPSRPPLTVGCRICMNGHRPDIVIVKLTLARNMVKYIIRIERHLLR